MASWTASFAVNARLFGIGPGRRVAVLGALEHSLSLYGALEGAHLGGGGASLAGLRPDRQAAEVARRGVDTVYATPAQLRALVGGGRRSPCRAAACAGGGSKLDGGLARGLGGGGAGGGAARVLWRGGGVVHHARRCGHACGCGRAALSGVEVEVRAGEVWVKSPYLFEGYASDPGSAEWRDGWLSVGEMGRLEGGFLYLDGRKGRMVTVADQNVFPEAIEAFLEGLPGVARAAVLAVPDAARGHVLRAVCQGDRGAAAVLAALRAEFGPMKAPRRIDWRKDWPVLPSGKTDLRALEGGR